MPFVLLILYQPATQLMNPPLLAFLLVLLTSLFSCSYEPAGKTLEPPNATSTIGTSDASQELAGSAYYSRATAYFTIEGNDTLSWKVYFSESHPSKEVVINLRLPYGQPTYSYAEWMSQLPLILETAAREYPLDSIRTISIGRLILTGDLAVAISREYQTRFPQKKRLTTSDYAELALFLAQSRLQKDFDSLLAPFQLYVSSVELEKAFFTTPDEIPGYRQTVTDTARLPASILDCITWIRVKRK